MLPNRVKLTDLTINNLTRPGHYWDLTLPGFAVRVGKKRKTFIVMIRKSRKSIGHYGRITLQDARKRARHLMANHDPDAPPTTTVTIAVDEYLRTLNTRPRTRYEYERLLRKATPQIGTQLLTAITPRQILAITDPLRHTPSEARHTHNVLKTFFTWCVPRFIEHSPMAHLRPPAQPKSRDRVLTPDELVAVYNNCHDMNLFGSILQLAILTAQRRGELSQIKDDWIQGDYLVIPGAFSKNKRQHFVPLSLASNKLARKIATESKIPFNGWGKAKKRLDARCQIPPFVIHDLRRTAASFMAAPPISAAPHIIERALNHITGLGGALHLTYQRYQYQTELCALFKSYEAHLVSVGIKL